MVIGFCSIGSGKRRRNLLTKKNMFFSKVNCVSPSKASMLNTKIQCFRKVSLFKTIRTFHTPSWSTTVSHAPLQNACIQHRGPAAVYFYKIIHLLLPSPPSPQPQSGRINIHLRRLCGRPFVPFARVRALRSTVSKLIHSTRSGFAGRRFGPGC